MLLAVWNPVFPMYSEPSTGSVWHRDIRSVSALRILLLSCFESASQRLWSSAGTNVTALAQKVPDSHQPLAWFREFLKEELTPYPGRAALACRMVIAATLVMIITMTFRMPYGAYGAIYALTISRESPQTTVKTVKTIVIAFLIGAAYILVGALFFLDDPMLRFLWVIGAFFTMFYAISVLANYGAATRFGYLIVITVPLWDRHIPAELKVEGT